MDFPVFDTLEAVPDAFRELYDMEADGKWRTKPASVPDVTKLQTALDAQRTIAENEERSRKKAEKEISDLKRAADARAKGITEEQLAEIQAKEALARKPIEDELATTKAENRKLKLTDRVKALALASGVMPDRIGQAMKDLEGRVDLTEDGNSIVVKDVAGKVTAETINDFLSKTYKTEAPFFYVGSGTSGSGADGSDGGSGQSGYDPVAAGKAAAAEQKKSAGESALAFK